MKELPTPPLRFPTDSTTLSLGLFQDRKHRVWLLKSFYLSQPPGHIRAWICAETQEYPLPGLRRSYLWGV